MKTWSDFRTAAGSVPVTLSHMKGPWALSAIFASYVPVTPWALRSARESSELRLRARPSAMPVSEAWVLRKGLPSKATVAFFEFRSVTVLCDRYSTGTSTYTPAMSAAVSSSPGSRTYQRLHMTRQISARSMVFPLAAAS